MAYEKKDNQGVLFTNTNKKTDNHPDFKGNATIGGVEYWVSGWEKTSLKGDTFYSLSFQKKEAQEAATAAKVARAAAPTKEGDEDEDLPF